MMVDARGFWKALIGVTFISPSEEDERLAEVERIARETLAEKGSANHFPRRGGGLALKLELKKNWR